MEISAGEGRDIRGQKRRYPPAKLRNGPTDKVHIAHNSANGLYINLSFASDFSLSGSNRELVKGQFHCSDLFVV